MDDELFFNGVLIVVLLLVSAFFSAAETALTAVSRARIYQLVEGGNKRARIVSKLKEHKESLIGTVLLGNNAVNIAASAIATALAVRLYGDKEGLVVVTFVMTLLVVIFAEIIPKTYAIQRAESASLALAPLTALVVKLFTPVTASIQVFTRAVLRLFGVDITQSSSLVPATDVIRGTIELHHREGGVVKQDRDMLGSILDLDDIEVKDVMLHRKQVETLDSSLPADELVAQAVSTMHSRLPLWKDEPDNIVGLLHVKDVIRALNQNGGKITSDTILRIAHKPWFIPDTTSLREQLLAFRSRRQHFAFVVDEYGGWQGIVSLEDIIEEIVGDIEDEHDVTDINIQKIGEDSYLVDGSVTLRDLNRQHDWHLPDDNASTIAGLLIHEVQQIPAIGEHFDLFGFRVTVLEKEVSRLTKLRMEKLPTPPEEPEG